MRNTKRILAVVLSIAMIASGVTFTSSKVNAAETEYYKVEAEDMSNNLGRVMSKSEDSNGKHVEVHWNNDYDGATDISGFTYLRNVVNVETAGEYTIKVHCTTWWDVNAKVVVNGTMTNLTIPTGTDQDFEVKVNLNAGKNVVAFSWDDWAEVDYFMFPNEVTLVKETTPTYYPASESQLNYTWLNYDGNMNSVDAYTFTGTLYSTGLNDDTQLIDEAYRSSATFTIDVPSTGFDGLELNYYVGKTDEGSDKATVEAIVNGGAPVKLSLDASGKHSIDADTLKSMGIVAGTNTIMIRKDANVTGEIGIYDISFSQNKIGVTTNAKSLVEANNIRMLGRTLTSGTAQTMDWTNSGFSFVYTGEGTISANITSSTSSNLVVDINGTESIVQAARGAKDVVLAKNLAQGTYTVKVYKVTEANGYLTQLNSITYTDENATLNATQEAQLKFEFIGDSITCGNQIDSNTGAEDGYRAYASLLARAYGADWNTISCSGRGLMEGYNSEEGWAASQNAQMKDVFDYVSYFRDKTTTYDYSYQPDVLVISIGSNDLGENVMNTFGTTIEKFCDEVKLFSTKVRSKYPNTKIIWCYGTYFNNDYATQYKQAVESLNDDNMSFVNFPQLIGGKDGHPNYIQHERMSKILSEKISEMTGKANPLQGDNHYEAESGVLTANGSNASLKTESSLTAYSGNSYAADMNVETANPDNAAYITVPVSVNKAGIYRLSISYGTNDSKNPLIFVKSNSYLWNSLSLTPGASWDAIQTADINVYLKSGANTISITGATNNSWANIDCFELEYVNEGTEPPTNKPQQPTTEKPTTKVPTPTAAPTTKVKAPGKAVIKKVTNVKGKKAKLSLKKVTGAKGYQIKYSIKKSMKSSKTINSKKLTVTIKKLKNGKKYFFRARAYKINAGKKVYGKWSTVKSIKIKK